MVRIHLRAPSPHPGFFADVHEIAENRTIQKLRRPAPSLKSLDSRRYMAVELAMVAHFGRWNTVMPRKPDFPADFPSKDEGIQSVAGSIVTHARRSKNTVLTDTAIRQAKPRREDAGG